MVTSNTQGGMGTGGTGSSRDEGRRPENEGITEAARKEAAGIGEAAKERVRDFADEQRHAGAETVHNVAEAARSAADDLEKSSPYLARYAREAASAVDRFSDTLERRSITDVLRGVQDFARREPVAFFGSALLVGFAVSRFFGTSARSEMRRGYDRGYGRDNGDYDSDYGYDDDQSWRSRSESGSGREASMGTGSMGSRAGSGTMTNEFGRHQEHGSSGGLGTGSPAGGSSATGGSTPVSPTAGGAGSTTAGTGGAGSASRGPGPSESAAGGMRPSTTGPTSGSTSAGGATSTSTTGTRSEPTRSGMEDTGDRKPSTAAPTSTTGPRTTGSSAVPPLSTTGTGRTEDTPARPATPPNPKNSDPNK